MYKPRGLVEKQKEKIIHQKDYGKNRTRGGFKRRGRGVSQLFVGGEMLRDLKVNAHAFGDAIQDLFLSRYDGDMMLFSEDTGFRYAECDAYLNGYLPTTFHDVLSLEEKLGDTHGVLSNAWLSDQLALLEARFPLPYDSDPKEDKRLYAPKRKIAHLVRLAILRKATNGELASVVNNKGEYVFLRKVFNAELPVTARSLKKIFDFIVDANAATESEVLTAIARHVYAAEKWEGRRIGTPLLDSESGTEFDHTHIDVYETDSTEQLPEASFLSSAPFDLAPRDSYLVQLIENLELDHESDIAQADDSKSAKPVTGALDLEALLSANPMSSFATPDSLISQPSQLKILHENRLSATVRKVLATLTPREEYVVRARMGFGEDSAQTSEEIARDMGISKGRVRSEEIHAYRKLRHPSRFRRLKLFIAPGYYGFDYYGKNHQIVASEIVENMDRLEKNADPNIFREFMSAKIRLKELCRALGRIPIEFHGFYPSNLMQHLFEVGVSEKEKKEATFPLRKTRYELLDIFNNILMIALGTSELEDFEIGGKDKSKEEIIRQAARAANNLVKIVSKARLNQTKNDTSWQISFKM